MLYDIYKLNGEVSELAKHGEEGASEIRTIAAQLEESLIELCCSKEKEGEEIKEKNEEENNVNKTEEKTSRSEM